MLKPADYYDADYYQRGTTTGRSCYDDYRWLPEVSCRLAAALGDLVGLGREEPVLDFGCARGYLVRAFRLLFRDAYGCDHSRWAIENADPTVRTYLRLCTPDRPLPFGMSFRLIVAKDVLEHCDEAMLGELLARFRAQTRDLVVIVPLGDGARYVIPYMEDEPDHVLRQPLPWWLARVHAAGFTIKSAVHRVQGIKDEWAHYAAGHATVWAA